MRSCLWKIAAVFVLLLLVATARAQGPAKTTISDTLYDNQGNLASGWLVISNRTFTSPDGFPIPAVQTRYVVTGGVVNFGLVPNIGSTPAGSSYTVSYQLSDGLSNTETWVVPQSVTPVALVIVRALSPPLPTPMLAFSQLNPPANCTGLFPQWTGTGWTCSSSSATSLLSEWQFGTQTPITGANNSLQLTASNIFALSQTNTGPAYVDTLALASQSENCVLASPNGTSGAPTCRALVPNDLPSIPSSSLLLQFQFGSQPAITGVGNYQQLTASNFFSLTQSGNGSVGTPYVDTVALSAQSGNCVVASPADGSSAAPGCRKLISNDVPAIPAVFYTATESSATTWTVSAATHGLGAALTVETYDASGNRISPGLVNVDGSGNVNVTWAQAQAGSIVITQ